MALVVLGLSMSALMLLAFLFVAWPKIRKSLVERMIIRAMKDPYFHLEGYMGRWWLVRERWITWKGERVWQFPAVRVHRVLRSDNDRHLHCHPRNNASVILEGSYLEVLPEKQTQHPIHDQIMYQKMRRNPFRLYIRKATARHRLILDEGPVWSLFITWGRPREWGFHTEKGFVPWCEYLGMAEDEPASNAKDKANVVTGEERD